ncbi:uncharacterized protein LOC115461897 [Microcaecilia unicolor]|uniref:Neuronal regeneration-related protein n=1 Tax=Microcaecilia unicolor TaxID=1415580 RepID=A0A6P7XCD9_9AMPH|nr:uncharacterized protein LOC115461897 [Microcaecilia unicolor]
MKGIQYLFQLLDEEGQVKPLADLQREFGLTASDFYAHAQVKHYAHSLGAMNLTEDVQETISTALTLGSEKFVPLRFHHRHLLDTTEDIDYRKVAQDWKQELKVEITADILQSYLLSILHRIVCLTLRQQLQQQRGESGGAGRRPDTVRISSLFNIYSSGKRSLGEERDRETRRDLFPPRSLSSLPRLCFAVAAASIILYPCTIRSACSSSVHVCPTYVVKTESEEREQGAFVYCSSCVSGQDACSWLPRCHTMICRPWLAIWSHQDSYVTSQGDGRFLEELFHISTKVNHKKSIETEAAFLAPENGYGHHVSTINYLSFF